MGGYSRLECQLLGLGRVASSALDVGSVFVRHSCTRGNRMLLARRRHWQRVLLVSVVASILGEHEPVQQLCVSTIARARHYELRNSVDHRCLSCRARYHGGYLRQRRIRGRMPRTALWIRTVLEYLVVLVRELRGAELYVGTCLEQPYLPMRVVRSIFVRSERTVGLEYVPVRS